MAGRTPALAVHAFVDPLQRALSCITDQPVTVAGGYHPSPEPHTLTLARGEPVGLRGDARLSLTIAHQYRVREDEGPRGPWRVSTAAYRYTLSDAEGREILAYHWHPWPGMRVTWPHLHLEAGAQVGRQDLARAHLPTGRVAIEDVLALAIAELGVRPLRADWREVLDESLEGFRLWRTWA